MLNSKNIQKKIKKIKRLCSALNSDELTDYIEEEVKVWMSELLKELNKTSNMQISIEELDTIIDMLTRDLKYATEQKNLLATPEEFKYQNKSPDEILSECYAILNKKEQIDNELQNLITQHKQNSIGLDEPNTNWFLLEHLIQDEQANFEFSTEDLKKQIELYKPSKLITSRNMTNENETEEKGESHLKCVSSRFFP